MNLRTLLFAVSATLIAGLWGVLHARPSADPAEEHLQIQPRPVRTRYHGTVRLSGRASTMLTITAESQVERKAADYFRRLMEPYVPGMRQDRLPSGDKRPHGAWLVVIAHTPGVDRDEQAYTVRCDSVAKVIRVESAGQLGLLYGVVTLSECFRRGDRGPLLTLCDIDDSPVYKRRIVASRFTPENVEELLDLALRQKIECVAIASRDYPWDRVDSTFLEVLRKIGRWKERFGGPRVMQMHNVYDGRAIEIANPEDIAALKQVIEVSVRHGVEKLMILADDLAPFEFGQGYVLTSGRDRTRFAHMAEAHCFLMQELHDWLKGRTLQSELYYVPPYYTYEDMYCGDMDLFRGTPWEEDAFRPLFRDLAYVGTHMPPDVYIVWSGPHVRSRTITVKDLEEWTRNLAGRAPFLWDNTIYSHHPFTTTPLFTAYDNVLPPDFHSRTAGEGMYLNGDLALEETRAAAVTANDFWWDPASYDPQASLRTAMERLYGAALVPVLMEFAETELALRRIIGERRLWFEADTLWREIREIRGITDKNPFAYHLNYTRLKALRMQLKASVPKPGPLPEFLAECRRLDDKRRGLLDAVGRLNAGVSARLRALLVPLPSGEEQ